MISQISLIFFFFWSPELPILPLTLSKRIKGPKNQLDLRVRLFPLVLSSCVPPPRSPSFRPTRHPRRSYARSRSASRRPAAAEAPAAPRRVGGGRLRGGLGSRCGRRSSSEAKTGGTRSKDRGGRSAGGLRFIPPPPQPIPLN